MPNLSWGDAFASAAKIEPEDLGEDFLRRTAPSTASNSSGGSRISEVAQSFLANQKSQSLNVNSLKTLKKKKKSKKKKRKDDKSLGEGIQKVSEQNDSNLCPSEKPKKKRKKEKSKPVSENADDEEVEEKSLEGRLVNGDTLVLVDKSNGKVFSGIDRDANGNYLHIGSIDSKDEISLFPKQTEEKSSEDSSEREVTNEAKEKNSPNFPYPTESDDHCETPLVAYKHIIPLLERIRKENGNITPENLRVYDPYFCDGSVVKKMTSLGYPNVYNKKEDCYKVWEEKEINSQTSIISSFDVFLTNPPYSGDHIDRLMKFTTASSSFKSRSRPWFLLMPNWVHKKDYYLNAIKKNGIQPFYLVPKKRYVYEPPKDFRAKKASDTHKKSSPFVSMWYIWGGTKKMNDILYNECTKRGGDIAKECEVARSKSALRDLRRGGKGKKKK